jgi:hypothetical protein
MLSRLDVRELYERSKHGKSNRWDKIGEIVKIRFVEVTRPGCIPGICRLNTELGFVP